MKQTIIREVELVEDLKKLIIHNSDTKLSKELLDYIFSLDDDELVMVEKEIYCGIIIWKVDLITDEYISRQVFGEEE